MKTTSWLRVTGILLLAATAVWAADSAKNPPKKAPAKAVPAKSDQMQPMMEMQMMDQMQPAADQSAPKPAAVSKPADKPTQKKVASPKPAANPQAVPAISLYESSAAPRPANELDKIIFARLAELKIQPKLCSDAVFCRRAYLDVIGTLPTMTEARAFLNDKSPDKRVRLIDQLMKRDEYAAYYAMKWGDILRIKAEFPVNLWPNAAQAYHRYVFASIRDNKPYDQIARELLTSSGSNFRVGPVNFYRAIQSKTPEGITSAVALTLMGSRTDSWPADRLKGTTAFFSQIGYKPTSEWKEECVFWDPLGAAQRAADVAPGHDKPTTVGQVVDDKDKNAGPATPPLNAIFPDGKKVTLSPNQDPREVFADWLINPKNPWFAKAAVNREWAWLMGRGIVDEPDDIRPDNPPSNPKLLACLEKHLVDSGYDLNHIRRMILTSTAYQFSSATTFKHPKAAENFAAYPLRRMEAEVLIDAINQITDTRDLYTSPIPEPFTYIPDDMRAIEIADGSITSTFLTLFGRSARATGMVDERAQKPVSAQWLHMLNSGHIQDKLNKSTKVRALYTSNQPPIALIDDVYLMILSRHPAPQEFDAAMEYGRFDALNKILSDGKKPKKERESAWAARREAWIDLCWALINTQEFMYRH